jgi:hypothetical protein
MTRYEFMGSERFTKRKEEETEQQRMERDAKNTEEQKAREDRIAKDTLSALERISRLKIMLGVDTRI